jgi:cell division protein FtsL
MTRVNFMLAVALTLSSLYLVKTSHESRLVFAAIDRAKNEQLKLDGEYKRLEAERQLQRANLNVERKARERLGMRTANPAVTQYVQDVASAQGASGQTAAPSSAATPSSATGLAGQGRP